MPGIVGGVTSRVGLDGAALPARLPATAAVFAAGQVGLRHVDAIARVLGSGAAQRLSPARWAGVEERLAAEAGHFDDAAMFDAIATVVDAKAKPLTRDDHRSAGRRQDEALADVCGYVLDHGDVPACGGYRPHVNVLVRLDDLQHRARAACLDFGGTPSPEALRMLCGDAAAVPIVLNGKGQPLDVGRATRTIPDGLRRAGAARDQGCAHPGCDRPPSWCECHHVIPWECGGDTKLANLAMLCKVHHRQTHFSDWVVRIRNGLPEFVPPEWWDPTQEPRRKPLAHLAGVCS